MIQLYIYIHSSSYSFPLWFITGYWIQFPVLYSRTLLFIHSLYTSLHLLIQTPNPTLSQPPAFLKNFYWSTVALPCRVCFHCTIKWIHYKYTQIPSFLDFLPIYVTTDHWVEFPGLYSRFSLVIYFTGLGRSPGEGNGYPLQYSGLENSMDYSMGSQRVGHWATSTYTH